MMTHPALYCCLLLAGLLPTGMAMAQADQVADCERQGVSFSKRQGGDITRIQIERTADAVINRYDDMVGSQRVSTEFIGFARVTSPSGAKRMRYVCLHDGKRAVYLGLID
jgi:hypothetical protein